MRRLGSALKVAVVGVTVGAMVVLGAPLAATAAAPSWVDAPNRLYMLPTNGASTAPVGFPTPIPQTELLFDDSEDQISGQLRKLEVESAEVSCDPAAGNNFDFLGCTAVQLRVSHGVLDFTDTPSAVDDPDSPSDIYQLPGGATVRDMDAANQLPAPVVALLGTTAQVNAALDTLRYTPDADYYYTGSNGEELELDLVPGDNSLAIVSIDVQIRVVDYNDAPSVSVPAGVTEVASDQDAIVGLGSEWSVEDEDNDEPTDGEDPPGSGNDPYDGDGREFLLVGWSSCGSFAYQAASGFVVDDNITDLLAASIDADPIPTAEQMDVIAAMADALPSSIFGHAFENENPNEFHAAWAGIAGDIEDINYALDEVTFRAQDPATNDPLADTTCQLYTFVSDLGNNGLPGAYTGAPPDGLETPWVAYDPMTNFSAGVEKVDVKVGLGTEITASVTGTTVNEGGTSNVTVDISPAEHPAFTLTATTANGIGATDPADYLGFGPFGQLVPVPANATSVTIPVTAFADAEFDPAETFLVSISDPTPGTPPPGYRLTVSAAPATVTIIDPGQDVTSPTATVGQAAGQLDPALFSPILFTIVFSEAVTGFGDDPADLDFTGSSAGALTGTVSGSGDTYQVAVQGMTTSGTVVLSVPAGAAEDSSGNPSDVATAGDNEVEWQQPNPGDMVPPSASINQGATQVDPATLAPVIFEVHFSEQVAGFDASDLVFTGTAGVTDATVTGSGQDYVVSVSSIPNFGTIIANLPAGAAQDANGNPSLAATFTDNQVTYQAPDPGDVTPPSVTINQAAAQTDPTSTASIVFDVVFSEPVTGFDGTDVALSGTGSAGTTANVLGSGSTYTVIVSGMTVPGTVIASIPAGAAQDAAAIPNASLASTSMDNTVTWQAPPVDVTPPTVTINQGAMQSDPTTFSPVVFDVEFSEPVTGFDAIDVSVTGTANGSGAVVTGSGAVYQVQVSGMTSSGTVVATINPGAAMDAASNPSLASTSTDNTVTYNEPLPGDITPPTVTLEQAAGQSDPTSASPVEFTVTFSEPVAGFTAADVDLSLSTAPGVVANVSGGGPVYTVTVTGMSGSGSIIASIPAAAAQDAAANASLASLSIDNTVTFTFVADTIDPTVTINQGAAQVDPTSASTVVFDVLFSEPVLGFTAADITIGGTALATSAIVTGAGPAYTVTVSGMTVSGTVTASIAASTVTDVAGNPNEGSTSTDNTVTFALDVMAPTVTVEQGAAQVDPTAASPIVFDVLFSEPVTGFTDADVAFTGSTAGGTLVGAVSGSGATYTITVTGMTTAGTVVPSLLAGAAVDVGSNPSGASTSTDNTVTWAPIVAPLVVIVPPDVTVVAAQGQSGAFVTFPTPTATGGVPPVTVVCDHNSGDFFPVGTTIVTCTATDSAEVSLFAETSATFSVTVTAAPAVPPAVLGNTGLLVSPIIALGVLLVGAGALVLIVRRRAAA